MSDHTITLRELETLREVAQLADPERDEAAEERSFRVLDILERLLGCDGLSLQVTDSVHRKRPYVSAVGEGEHFVFTREELEASEHEPGVDVFWECWWTSPCSLPERTGRPVVVSLRSVYSQRQWAAHPLHTTYLPCADELVLAYVTGPGQSVRLLVPREGGSPFGERERTLLELLLPHLRDLLVAASARPKPAAAATLTGRQREILRFVARGLTNREIGRALGIREGTVRKHLEHSYLRLGVLSRTGAVAAAFGDAGTAG
ncbi:MAG TPA: helix-turn-helix transcriptional regulator [Ornithinicoccus sp.]|nr:helix-turn-helix transcriptional regulator [Ornithinicoccus sp.]